MFPLARRLMRSRAGRLGTIGSVVILLTACNALANNYYYGPSYVQDTAFTSYATGANTIDSEAAAVYFDGKWFIYVRCNNTLGGTIPKGLAICVSTSTNGYNGWVNQLGDPTPTIAVSNGAGPGDVPGCGQVYAPKVLVQPGLLTMVMEANPTTSGTSTSTCSNPRYNQVVAISTSANGWNWSPPKRIITAFTDWEGHSDGATDAGNVGTPTITHYGGKYYIGYHGFSGNPTGAGALKRGYQTWSVSDTRDITADNRDARNNNPSTFDSADGTPAHLPMYSVGFGEADIMQCQGGTNSAYCGGDASFYMAVEGFHGAATCGSPGLQVSVLLAQAQSPAGPWTLQDNHPFHGAHNNCGWDLPSWQYNPAGSGSYHMIVTNGDTQGLQRVTLNAS